MIGGNHHQETFLVCHHHLQEDRDCNLVGLLEDPMLIRRRQNGSCERERERERERDLRKQPPYMKYLIKDQLLCCPHSVIEAQYNAFLQDDVHCKHSVPVHIAVLCNYLSLDVRNNYPCHL